MATEPVNGAVPPNGWEIPPADEPHQRPPEFDTLAQAWARLLTAMPDDLRRAAGEAAKATAEAARALLELVRALIDWIASRLEGRRSDGGSAAVQVHDIPIL